MAESIQVSPEIQLFRDVFNASPIGIAVENLDGQLLFVNPAFCRFLGFTEEELRSKHCVDFSPKEDAERDWALFQQLRAGSIEHYQMEKRYFRRDGSLVWGRLSLSLLSSRPSPLVIAMVEDITEKKTAEEARHESEERLRLAVQAGRMFAYSWDAATDVIERSGESAAILGVKSDQVATGAAISAMVHPDDKNRLEAALSELKVENPTLHITYRINRPDGVVAWLERNSRAYFDAEGKLKRVVGMVADVTERKRAEQALRESEQRFRLAAQAGRMYSFDWDVTTDVVLRSSERADVLGLAEPLRFTHTQFLEKMFPDDRQTLIATIAGLTPEKPTAEITYRMQNSDGALVSLRSTGRAFFNAEGKLLRVIGMVADITDLKLAEEALRASEERLRLAQQAARIGTFEWNIQTGVNTWTPELEEIYGLPRGGFGGTQTAFESLVYADDRAEVIALNNRAMKSGLPTQGEWRVVWADGSMHWIAGRWQVFMSDSGEPSRMVGINIDITDRKRAEQEFSKANERLRLALEAGSAGGWDFDLRTGKNVWFGKAHALLGMTHDETLGSVAEFWARVHEDDRALVEHALQISNEKHDEFAEDFRVVWRDGTTHWLRSRGRHYYSANGEAERMLGICIDITDRKRTEEALLRHAAIVESSEDAIISKSLDGVIVSWNKGAQQLYGYTEAEAVGKPITILVPPELREEENRILERLRAGEHTEHYETLRITKTGRGINISLSLSPIKDSNGRMLGISSISRDITERKRAERDLLSSEQRYRLLFERNVAGVAIASVDARLLDCNDGWVHILGYESKDELLGRHASEFYFNPAERKPLVDELFQKQVLFSRELHLRRKDGTPVWVLFNAAVHSDRDTPLVQCTMIDISEWKRAEEALSGMTRKLIESQEQERARIGRELHDDVNQRLAMLSVEVEQLRENPSEIELRVGELRKRIGEISNDVQALSHDLHSSKLEYLGVLAGIKSWCKEFAERQKMDVDFRSDLRSALPLDIGVPIFRVLQEALHNAAKHSGARRIDVELHEEASEIHLTIRDLGKGFELEGALQGKGLGLTSMRERVRLLNGTIIIESKPMSGTTIHVRVPLESQKGLQREAV